MANRFWVGGTAAWDATAGSKWALTSGGAGGQAVPTAADDVFLDGASGAVTVTISGARTCKSLVCTGFTGTLAGTSTPSLTVAGNFTLVAGMTINNGNLVTASISATSAITMAGKTWNGDFIVNGSGATFTLQDTFRTLGTFQLVAGTLNANNQDVTVGAFSIAGTVTRAVTFGTGLWTLNSSSLTNVLAVASFTNLTFTTTGSTIIITGSGARTIAGASGSTLTLNNLQTGSALTDLIYGAGNHTVSGTFTPHVNLNSVTGGGSTTLTWSNAWEKFLDTAFTLASSQPGNRVFMVFAAGSRFNNTMFKDINLTGAPLAERSLFSNVPAGIGNGIPRSTFVNAPALVG